jgi:L-malate glycosyltransferase
MEIHQLLPGFSCGDAISISALEMRNLFRSWGFPSEIYTCPQYIHPLIRREGHDYRNYGARSSKENIVIYHFSVGSELTPVFQQLPDKKVMVYHNITPAEFIRETNPEVAAILEKGRLELSQLKDTPLIALADSEYNRQELDRQGYANTDVLPLLIDFSKYPAKPRKAVMKRYQDGFVNLFFAGRVAPNKKHEDLIKVFYFYNRYINSHSRLILVGSWATMERYYQQLNYLVEYLKLDNVVFTGLVDADELVAYYRVSDIFITMSEHEGFCLPLLEAMHYQLPILAYNATAIPYTLGNAGILIEEKRYEEIAEIIDIIMNDRQLQETLKAGGRKQLESYDRKLTTNLLKGHLETIMG